MTESSSLFNPFPGLRPFRESETHLFFGRNAQIDELLAELGRSRFVAVMGASGSGKSSLVAAGLLPALLGGLSTILGANWRIASFRPGGNPIRNLARALAVPDILGRDGSDELVAVDRIEAVLRRSGLGLADVAKRDERMRDGRLLIVVDQFEELFRFQGVGGGEGDNPDFVQLLIEATGEGSNVAVILTMRSDYLGDCSQFSQLPETINRGLYLVPRLTRIQLRETITGPVAVGGGAIAPRLVQRLLNDAGGDPDILPVLQHALMRTWDLWAGDGASVGPIDLEHYEAGGGLEDSLARHADEAYHELADARSRRIAEVAFKRLTELGTDGREGRRPSPLGEIAAVSGATVDEVREVIGHFEEPGRSFVTVSNDGVVDISHESLIRQWPRLREWVGEEADSRDTYGRLAEAAGRWRRGEAALLRDPDLQLAVNWWTDNEPSDAWADRYDPTFEAAADYLDRSRKAANRRRVLSWAGVAALGVVAVLFGVLAAWANRAENEAQYQERLAVGRQLAAVSEELGPELRTTRILTALEALRTTETDSLRLPEAEEALRSAMQDPLGRPLPVRAGQLGHEEDVTALEFSADGRWLATGSLDDVALLWDLEDLEADPLPLPGHEGDVVTLAFSPKGRWLATGSMDDTVLLWDLEDPGADPVSLDEHFDDITALAFSPDGKWLATASIDGTAGVWDIANPDRPFRILDNGSFVFALAFDEEGGRLATGNGDGEAWVWDMTDLDAEPVTFSGHSHDVIEVAFTPDGDSLATGSRDNTVRVWSLTDPSNPSVVLDQGAAVVSLALSPDGRWLVTGSEDNAARLWDLQTAGGPSGPSLVLLHSGRVEQVAFSDGGRWLATGGPDDAARLFQMDALAEEPVVLAGPVTALAFSPDNGWLAIGSDHGSARIWMLDQLSTQPAVLRHDSAVTALSFSPDGRLATGTAANTAQLWKVEDPGTDPEELEQETVEGFEQARVETMAFSPDGRWLATGSGDMRVRLWSVDPSGAELEPSPPPFDGGVNALAFSPDSRTLGIAVKDEVVLLWDMAARSSRRLEGHRDEVLSVVFSPDGRWLATASRDGEILVWDLHDLDADPERFTAHEDRVTSLAFDGDGRRLASGSWDETVRLWEVGTWSSLPFETGSRVTDIAFRVDGQLLAVAGEDAQLWDLTAADPTDPIANPVVLRGHSEQVETVAFSADGRWLATGSSDQTVRLWLQLDELIELGCAGTGRNLSGEEEQEIDLGATDVPTCEQWPDP